MRAGRLRHRLVIERPATGQDVLGAPVDTWVSYATRWAGVEPLSGREFFAARQVHAEVTHRIRLRHLEGVTPRMRATMDGRIFRFEVVRDVGERGRELDILATEEV